MKEKGFRSALVFIIQREDVEYFRPNYLRDKIYSEKLKEAFDQGVEIYAYKFQWKLKNNYGVCNYLNKISVKFDF